jgi:hypothetical protein
MMDLGLRGAEIVNSALRILVGAPGTLVVRDERLGANIKLQLDIGRRLDCECFLIELPKNLTM